MCVQTERRPTTLSHTKSDPPRPPAPPRMTQGAELLHQIAVLLEDRAFAYRPLVPLAEIKLQCRHVCVMGHHRHKTATLQRTVTTLLPPRKDSKLPCREYIQYPRCKTSQRLLSQAQATAETVLIKRTESRAIFVRRDNNVSMEWAAAQFRVCPSPRLWPISVHGYKKHKRNSSTKQHRPTKEYKKSNEPVKKNVYIQPALPIPKQQNKTHAKDKHTPA